MNNHQVIGYTTDELIEAMGRVGIHCSLSKMKEFAIEIQRRALADRIKREEALGRMVENAELLNLYDGPAIEMRVLGEPE